jgi:2-polyprenyl-3-methyl-5-hydroxy-6-metoxy-1,4-benzoquinol methylase
LDFGCGPTRAFSEIARRDGFVCDSYDPIFHPEGAISSPYDFVFCSEVVEHFVDVRRDWEGLLNHLKPGGHFGVMTAFVPGNFAGWHYPRDPTHVTFYSPKVFQWLARGRFEILALAKDILIARYSSPISLSRCLR